MAQDNKSELIVIRVSPELKAELQKLANADQRKLSDYARIQLQKLVKKTTKA